MQRSSRIDFFRLQQLLLWLQTTILAITHVHWPNLIQSQGFEHEGHLQQSVSALLSYKARDLSLKKLPHFAVLGLGYRAPETPLRDDEGPSFEAVCNGIVALF